MTPQKITKKEINAWAIVDTANGEIPIYDHAFQNLLNIHPTRNSARNSLRANSISAKRLGVKVIPCTITLHLPKKPTKKK